MNRFFTYMYIYFCRCSFFNTGSRIFSPSQLLVPKSPKLIVPAACELMFCLFFSDQTKLIDLEEMAKTMAKGKWAADASNVSFFY